MSTPSFAAVMRRGGDSTAGRAQASSAERIIAAAAPAPEYHALGRQAVQARLDGQHELGIIQLACTGPSGVETRGSVSQ